MQVVAVVPDHEQPGRDHRCEGRRPGADDDPDLPATHREPPAVALGRPEIRGQRDDRLGAEQGRAGGAEDVDVALVGHDEQGAATRVCGGLRGVGEPTAHASPGSACQTACAARPCTQRAQERGPRRNGASPDVDACRAALPRGVLFPLPTTDPGNRDARPRRRPSLGPRRRRCRGTIARGEPSGAPAGLSRAPAFGIRPAVRAGLLRLRPWRAAAARRGEGRRPARRCSDRPPPGTARRSPAARPARWRPPSPARRAARGARTPPRARARTRRRGVQRTEPAPAHRCLRRRRGVRARRSRRAGRGGPAQRRPPPCATGSVAAGRHSPRFARRRSSSHATPPRLRRRRAPGLPDSPAAPRTAADGGDIPAFCAHPPTASARDPGPPIRRRRIADRRPRGPERRTRRVEVPGSPCRAKLDAVLNRRVQAPPGTSGRRRGRSTPTAARCRCARSARTPRSARRSGATGRGRG